MTKTIQQARDDISLREMTLRVKEHYNRIQKSMNERQTLWGGNLTVINDETEKLSATIRRSLAFEKVMHEMPIAIEPYALLAGRSEKDGMIVRCMLPSFVIEKELPDCSMYISHKCPDYETLLKVGLSGIRDSCTPDSCTPDKSGSCSPDKHDFCEAVHRECNAVIALSHRYAELAEEKGMSDLAAICRKVPEHGAESFHEAIQSLWFYNHCIHETMTRLSIGNIDRVLYPYFEKDFIAGKITLEEAQELVDTFNLRVNDRTQIDPSKYVVNQKDLEGAPEKYFRIGSNVGFADSAENDGADAINHWGQNILISGLLPDGSDGTNALTYMFLNAHEKFQLANPVLTVRLHKNSPSELVMRVAEVLKTGGGMPFINNDDIIIPAYEKIGVSHEDACWYANSNCWETLIQGRSNQEMIRFVNFLYLLELALNNGQPVVRRRPQKAEGEPEFFGYGRCPGNPVYEGPGTGNADSMTSMDDIIEAWKKQLDYMLETSMAHVAKEIETHGTHGYYTTMPILSAMTRDCIERTTDLTHGGSRYDLWHILAEAVSNTADALSAIQKFVFDEKVISLGRLVEILNNDWHGEEELRARFMEEPPRFGNGETVPDGYAKDLVDFYVERVEHHAKKHTICMFSPSIATFSWVISIGKNIGASADGRKSMEPIAANMSPVPGADKNGPVAAIQSYLKLNTASMAAGAPIDLRLNKRGLEGDEGSVRIAGLIKTFVQQGGNMMTLTVTSADELRSAMADPEKYRSLRVRMGGWSAYFVLLSKEAQELQIRRAGEN